MLKRLATAAGIAASVLTAGCLQKETSHVLYLAPDGSAGWVISEANVRSDEKEPAARLNEEQQYFGQVLLGTHRVARGLSRLGPAAPVRTTVIRDERPFHVVTDAHFVRVDDLFERLFATAGVKATASFAREGNTATLKVVLDCSQELPGSEDAADLFPDAEHFRMVLTEGEFLDVAGFDVAEHSTATFSAGWMERAEQACGEKRPVEFALSWRY